jgi:hypothetical protein
LLVVNWTSALFCTNTCLIKATTYTMGLD